MVDTGRPDERVMQESLLSTKRLYLVSHRQLLTFQLPDGNASSEFALRSFKRFVTSHNGNVSEK